MKLSKLAQASVFMSLSALCFSTFAANSDEQLQKAVEVGQQINQSANKSQQKIDTFSQQIQTKLQQFKTVNKEIDGLDVYNQQMNTQVANQLKELEQIAVSMEQVSIIERQVSPLMARMIETLDNFVALDMPFLPEERTARIASLKNMLERADVSISEKFRRVLEAYQIEAEYGRSIEAYTGLVDIDGSQRDVDFLRIGRVSFVYQTRDGNTLGIWNNQTKQWDALAPEYRLDVNKGLRIARKQLAPDLITVPVAQNSAE